jgi:hypothetical protein
LPGLLVRNVNRFIERDDYALAAALFGAPRPRVIYQMRRIAWAAMP